MNGIAYRRSTKESVLISAKRMTTICRAVSKQIARGDQLRGRFALQGKIKIVNFRKILRFHPGGDTLERIVFESPAMMTGRNDSFFCAKIGGVINLACVGAVGAEFINVLSEQHFFHLIHDYTV